MKSALALNLESTYYGFMYSSAVRFLLAVEGTNEGCYMLTSTIVI